MLPHFADNSRPVISRGQLSRNGQPYVIRPLKPDDIPASLDLQADTLKVLRAQGKGHYLIEKSPESFRSLLDAGHTLLGAFTKAADPDAPDRLAAHILVLRPQNSAESGLADPGVLPGKEAGDVLVVSNILVHQDFRGNGLMHKMLREGLALAAAEGKTHAVAEIAADNEFSWAVFLDCGFAITAEGFDPRDQSHLVYVQKPLSQTFRYSAAAEDHICLPLFDDEGRFDPDIWQMVQNYIQQGWHGTGFDRAAKMIRMERCTGTVSPESTRERRNTQPCAAPALAFA